MLVKLPLDNTFLVLLDHQADFLGLQVVAKLVVLVHHAPGAENHEHEAT